MARNFSHMAIVAYPETTKISGDYRPDSPPHLARLPKPPRGHYAGLAAWAGFPALLRGGSRLLGFLFLGDGGLSRKDCDRTPGFFDFVLGRGAKAVGRNGQFFGQLAVAENLEHLKPLLEDAGFGQRFRSNGNAGVKQVVQIANIDFGDDQRRGIRESPLGHAANQRHLAALEDRQSLPASASELPLVSPAGGLALARAQAPSFAIGSLVLVNALIDLV